MSMVIIIKYEHCDPSLNIRSNNSSSTGSRHRRAVVGQNREKVIANYLFIEL